MPDTTVTAGRRSQPVRHYHHGQSPAAWTGVIVSGIGFIVAAIAAVLGPNWTLVYIGGGLVVLGLIAAALLKGMGYGNN